MKRPAALVVDKDPSVRARFREVLEGQDIIALGASTGAETMELLKSHPIHILVVDVSTPGVESADLVRYGMKLQPAPVLIGLAPSPDGTETEGLIDAGAFDVLVKPVDDHRLQLAVRRALRQHALVEDLRHVREELQRREGYHGLVGRSARMERLRDQLERLAVNRTTVWFVGEEGSGKELTARTLQRMGPGPAERFVVVPCASLDARTWDRRWAGRNGSEDHSGLLAQADGGSLYLDGVAELTHELQERLVQTLRGAKQRREDVRFLGASGADPEQAVDRGQLIEPLYRELAFETLHIPALRERTEDIPLLARHFVSKICEINHLPPIQIDGDAIQLLERYHWPENVQELRNAMEQAVILALDGQIRARDLPDRIRDAITPAPATGRLPAARRFRDAKRVVVERFEQSYLSDLMERHSGNVTAAAQQAGMLRSALQRLLRKHGLRSADFRRGGRRPAASADPSRSTTT